MLNLTLRIFRTRSTVRTVHITVRKSSSVRCSLLLEVGKTTQPQPHGLIRSGPLARLLVRLSFGFLLLFLSFSCVSKELLVSHSFGLLVLVHRFLHLPIPHSSQRFCSFSRLILAPDYSCCDRPVTIRFS